MTNRRMVITEDATETILQGVTVVLEYLEGSDQDDQEKTTEAIQALGGLASTFVTIQRAAAGEYDIPDRKPVSENPYFTAEIGFVE